MIIKSEFLQSLNPTTSCLKKLYSIEPVGDYLTLYSFAPNCRGSQITHFWGKKTPQVHSIIIRE